MIKLKHTKVRLLITIVLFALFSGTSHLGIAQEGDVPKALKLLQKDRLDNAIKSLERIRDRDSLNPEYYYCYSVIYSTDSLPLYNVDTAYQYIKTALSHYKGLSDQRERDKLAKDGINEPIISIQKRFVEKLGFNRAFRDNSEEQYNYYLSYYDKSYLSDSAISLRNKAAFKKAVAQNTYSSYQRFMETYPNAREVDEARERFERLYFDERTKDGKLSSYTKFLNEHPNTTYRELAEQQIFELSTIDGTAASFLKFIKDYPNSKWSSVALNFAFHVDRASIPNKFWTDSLKKVAQIESELLIPFYKLGMFGFFNSKGEEILSPSFTEINPNYKCEIENTGFLILDIGEDHHIINKLGTSILKKSSIEEVIDMGQGLLWVLDSIESAIIHKSGEEIFKGAITDAKIVLDNFLAIQIDKQWKLFSLTGKLLIIESFDNVGQLNNILVVERESIHAIITIEDILATKEAIIPKLEFKFLEVEKYDSTKLIVRTQSSANIVDQEFNNSLPPSTEDAQIIEDVGVVAKIDGLNRLYDFNFNSLPTAPFKQYKLNKHTFYTKRNNGWYKLYSDVEYDSVIILSERSSLGLQMDSITFFVENASFKKPVESIFKIIRDNGYQGEKQEYLVFNTSNNTEVYNLQGIRIYEGSASNISALGPNLLVIEEKDKKGVINAIGKQLIPFKMDGIANYSEGTFSVLANGKFGIFQIADSSYIAPKYERIIKPYNDSLLIAFKDDHYGLISLQNEMVSPFEFEEIRYWNDSSALVKQNHLWKIYDWNNEEYLLDNIKQIQQLTKKDNEITAKVLIDNEYGILNNTIGMIVPASYNDVTNIGVDTPIYLAERNIEEADFYVTIYYNNEGEIIYKRAYEAPEYQKIVCDYN